MTSINRAIHPTTENSFANLNHSSKGDMMKGYLLFSLSLCSLATCTTVLDQNPPLPKIFEASAINIARDKGLPALLFASSRKPDSVGGVNVEFSVMNLSNETFKYVDFTGLAFNAVQDPVSNTITGTQSGHCRFTGPYAPGDSDDGICQNLWYNSSVVCVRLTEVKVTTMTESEIIIKGKMLQDSMVADQCGFVWKTANKDGFFRCLDAWWRWQESKDHDLRKKILPEMRACGLIQGE